MDRSKLSRGHSRGSSGLHCTPCRRFSGRWGSLGPVHPLKPLRSSDATQLIQEKEGTSLGTKCPTLSSNKFLQEDAGPWGEGPH